MSKLHLFKRKRKSHRASVATKVKVSRQVLCNAKFAYMEMV